MKKLLWMITVVLLAVPAFAQDDFGGFGGFDGNITGADLDALLGGGRGNRGGRGNNNNNIPDPESAFLQLRDLLKTHKVPLSKDQEKSLRTLLETETKTMRDQLEAQFANRGNNQNRNNQANLIGDLFTAVGKHNTELLTSMKTDMTPDQLLLIAKAEKDKKVCVVMLDMINVPELENRLRGNNNNNFNPGNFNFPGDFGDFNRGGDSNRGGGGGRGGNYNNNNNNANMLREIPDRASCTSANSTTAERLAPVSQVLSKGKKPLTPEQEKKFSGLIEAKVPQLEDELKAQNPQILTLVNQINNQNRNNNNNNTANPQQLRNNIVNTLMSQLGVPNNNNQGRGNRGGNNNNQNNANAGNNNAGNNNAGNNNNGGNRGNNNNFNPQAEIQKKNEELLDKVAASLNPDQQPVIKKFKYDQIKAKGGAERYRGILEQEGTPLTPEQMTQIQALFNSQNQAVRVFAEQLVTKELENAPPQPEPTPQQNQQNQQQNRNPNNVNQNPLAQQIVAKLLPQVSVQKARLEKVTQETIMKLLTPPQVASYKLNSL